ncbi:MAG: VCBS repeat-containing protein [Planctomycetota bacterium]
MLAQHTLSIGTTALALTGLAAASATAQTPFELIDASDAAGVTAHPYAAANGYTMGVAAADFDNDGDVDLFVPNSEGNCDLLFANRGDGTFDEIAQAVGVSGCDLPAKPRNRAALWFDYDGDRRLDLIVCGDAFAERTAEIDEAWTQPRLYRQLPDGTFADVSTETGIDAIDMLGDHAAFQPGAMIPIFRRHAGSIAAGDLNNDGFMDVMIGLWQEAGENQPYEIGARLLLNVPGDATGGRRFEDVTIATMAPGVPEPGTDHFGSFWQILMHDFNEDGLLDVYAAIDFDHNHLWLNTGTYEDPARPGVRLLNPFDDVTFAAGATSPIPENDMGATLGDCDNDGLFDVFVAKSDDSAITNDFYVARSADPVQFVERAREAGVSGDFGVGWGATFQDFNRDGWTDLAMTNGFNNCLDLARMMINAADPGVQPAFWDMPAPDLNAENRGSCIVAADLERDGDLDVIHTLMLTGATGCDDSKLQILRNEPLDAADARWLTIRPRQLGANFHAIGTVVRVQVDGAAESLFMSRILTAGTSMAGQEPAEAFFGLGSSVDEADAVTITIEWPGGGTPTVLAGTVGDFADRVVHVGPCSVVDLDDRYGSLNIFDLLAYINLYNAGDMTADLAAPVGTLDFMDVMTAIQLIENGCP